MVTADNNSFKLELGIFMTDRYGGIKQAGNRRSHCRSVL
jgi:hypothetical protein